MQSVKYDFSGSVAIVTGGARGIGAAICNSLAKSRARVVIADIDINAAIERERLIKDKGGITCAIKVDVSKRSEVERMVQETLNAYGQIDILVNNAGINTFHPFIDIPEEEYDSVLGINVKGTFLCSQLVLPHMMARRSGRIINISSQVGKTGQSFMAHYSASKFAVVGFTQSMALEMGPYGITVNAICPGDVVTEMREQTIRDLAPLKGIPGNEFDARAIECCPLGRLELPEDVANAVLFLASEGASFITGEALNVSGGLEFH